jgi:short-subunit dehydrogenase
MDNFKDKTVIITGGSEGVGAATARKFAAAGAKLLLVARSKKNLEKVAEELRPLTDVHIFAMDVSDAGACVDLFKKAEFEFGSVHVLINNAAYHKRGPVETVDANDLGRMIDVNLKAPIMLMRLAIPYLRKAEGNAAIINVASLAGRAPLPGNAAYSASKFGLRIFTFALADELRGSNIKLGVISPGAIDTAFIMENIDDVADVNFSQPLSTAEQVADEILALCLNEKREKGMPLAGAILTSLNYIFPWLRGLIMPTLERRGRRFKRALKAKIAAETREKDQQ